jgi:hypothetical protein
MPAGRLTAQPAQPLTLASPRRPRAIWARTVAVLTSYRNRPKTAFELRVCRVNALVGAVGYRAVSVTRNFLTAGCRAAFEQVSCGSHRGRPG